MPSSQALPIERKVPIRTAENGSRANDMATKSQIAKNGSHAAKAMAQRLISLRTISPRIAKSSFPVGHSPRELAGSPKEPSRSEEHTSELQSHLNLVCRLLLEKK